MRRSLAVLCAVTVGATALVATAPASAAPAPAAHEAAHAAVPDELLVGYVRGATATDRERARGRAMAQRQKRVVTASTDRTEVELVRIPAGTNREAAIRRLESDTAVAYAEPNWIYTHQATDSYYTSTDPAKDLWGMYGNETQPANVYGSQAGEAWATGTVGSATVTVGIIDEGIQFDHPDLAGQVWTNPADATFNGVDDDQNGLTDDVHGWDFANNDSSIYDGGTRGNLDDHGTHVSGTIGAKADNGGVVGVNHKVNLISGKFLGRNGGALSDAIEAVDYFTSLKKRGVEVVATNNSWGGGGFSQGLLDAITRAAKADILFIAAAGNSGTDNDASPSYPSSYDTTRGTSTEAAASYDSVIAVAAIDRTGSLASFSQFGKTSVDLGAPGVGVWSTTAHDGYSQYNGTSMATPHVAGAAALLAATKGGTAASIKKALLDSAVLTPSLCGKAATAGRLDVTAALAGVPRTAVCAATGGNATAAPTLKVTKGAKSGGYTAVTATWSDFAGTSVHVSRTGAVFTMADPGSLTERWSGKGTVTYTVCELDNSGCLSASVAI